jgi:hypothetical protein
MKKAIFLGLATLLALVVFSCGDFAKPAVDEDDGPRVMYTEDGQKLVRLDIGFKGNGRALTDNMARVATERYEVAFSDGTNVYRTSWADGERGRLWVATAPAPTGIDYAAGGNSAILFAGYSNGTLLAIGELSAVDNVPSVTAITDDSRSVTFTLTPLTNAIHSENAATVPLPSASTFKITVLSPVLPGYIFTNALPAFPKAEINELKYPVYELPINTTATATYTLTGLPTAGIVIAAKPRVIPKLIEVPGYYRAMDVTGFFDPALDPAAAALPAKPLPAPPWNLTLNTLTNEGLIKICFEIPVYAISKDTGWNELTGVADVKPGTWYIRGGISNTTLDAGKSRDSDGGAVLLGIGDYEVPSEKGWINVDTDQP